MKTKAYKDFKKASAVTYAMNNILKNPMATANLKRAIEAHYASAEYVQEQLRQRALAEVQS